MEKSFLGQLGRFHPEPFREFVPPRGIATKNREIGLEIHLG